MKNIRLHPSLPTLKELEEIDDRLAREVGKFVKRELKQRGQFKKFKNIDGGEKIRLPLNYGEE